MTIITHYRLEEVQRVAGQHGISGDIALVGHFETLAYEYFAACLLLNGGEVHDVFLVGFPKHGKDTAFLRIERSTYEHGNLFDPSTTIPKRKP